MYMEEGNQSLLLDETSFMHAEYSTQPPLSVPSSEFASPFHEPNKTTFMESLISIPSCRTLCVAPPMDSIRTVTVRSDQNLDSNQQINPYYYSPQLDLSEMATMHGQLGFNSMGPFPMNNDRSSASTSAPQASVFSNVNRDAAPIEAYFLRIIQPWPPRRAEPYTCDICHKVFPNGQAYGGHMSYHSKAKKSQAAAWVTKPSEVTRKSEHKYEMPLVIQEESSTVEEAVDEYIIAKEEEVEEEKFNMGNHTSERDYE